MKKLFGLLLVFVVFFSFFAHRAQAQTANASKAELEARGSQLFSNFVNQLQTKQNNPKGTIPSLASASDADVARYIQGNKDLIATINEGKSTFISLLASPAAASTNVYADFTAALNGASTRINTGQRTTPTIANNPLLRAEVSVISSQINTLAQERQQALINQGQGDAAVALQNQVATQRAAQKEPEVAKCISFTQFSLGTCVSEFVQWFIKNTFMQIAGFLLWITSNMFSYAVQVGILDFKSWASDALYPLWAVMRQIVSLGVVFVGLYLGFMYILGRADTFARYIPWVMIFALFVNFSYPIARFAIDISNVVSLNIYAAAFSNEALNGSSNASAGAVIMNRLGLADLVMGATYVEGGQSANVIKGINSVPAALLVVVFILYAAYVFFMATAILVMRTAALVFLIIASPFLFIDSVLPLLGDKAQQIRKIFFEQLAVGPIFMILIGLTTKFLLVFSEGPLKAQINSNLGGDSAGITVFFNVLMMIIMLHITLKVTKSVAGTIGQYATDAIGKVGGFAMGAATGGAGLLARNSLGRLAMKARDSKWVTNNANTAVGRRLYDMSNSLANSSYDLRNSSVVAGGMKRAGLGMGAGRTAGYEEAMEKRRQEILDRGARIKTRYERDVVDESGNILHRKGDIDKEADAAYDRYIAQGGGSVFMSQEQRQLAKEALGKQAGERSEKNIAEAKKHSDGDLSLYNNEKDPAEKERFVLELKRDLEKLKEADAELEGVQAQSIRRTLNAIEAQKRAKAEEFATSVQDSLERYANTKGSTPEKEQENKERLLNAISDLKVRAAVMQKLGIKGADVPSKQDDSEFIDLTEPNTPAGTRAARLQEAAERAQREMSRNASVRNENANTPEAANNSAPFAVAAQEKFDPKLQNIAQMFAEARAAAAINKAQGSSRGDSAGPEPSKQSTPPRAPAPQSGTADVAI